MGNRKPLDMSEYDESLYVDESEVDYQLEIVKFTPKSETTSKPNRKLEISSESNSKFKDILDHELDDEIKKHRGYLANLRMKDGGWRLEKRIEDLEKEKHFRENREKRKEQVKLNQGAKAAVKGFSKNGDNGRPMSTRASTHSYRNVNDMEERKRERNVNDIYAQTACSGRQSKIHAADSPPHSEELVIVNHTKGKGPFTLLSPNTEGGKDTSRIFSGDLAGPSPRLGLRSNSKQCPKCKQSCRDLSSCECRFYGKSAKRSAYFPEKESPKRNSAAGPASGRKSNGIKRARQGVGGGDSPEKVVELFSSEDEEDKETQDTNADCQIAPPRKVYGTRSTVSPSWEGVKIAYPSRDDPEAVEVVSQDILRLDPMEFLNDTVIDFYIKYIQRPAVLTEEAKNRFHFFNSFFYKKLSEVVGGQNKKTVADLSKLKRWTRKTKIFEKEYLFVPIHDKWHWSLAIVCHPGATSEDTGSERCILHLDSMSPGHKSNTVFRLLRTYLIAEWEHQPEKVRLGDSFQKLSNEDFIVKKIPVPQQENESDCGLFLLHYIEVFLKVAPASFKLSEVDKGKLFGRNWFKPKEASDLRGEIQALLKNFFDEESRAKQQENAEKIERLSLQTGSEKLLQSDIQHVHPSNVEVIESVDSPGRSSAIELVHEQNTPRTFVSNIESSSSGSTPKGFLVESAEQHLGDDVLKIDADISACSQANCTELRKSSELPTALVLGSSGDFESCVHLGATSSPALGRSDDNTKDMEMLNQLNSCNRDVGDDDQSGIPLVVDLPIQEEQGSAG